MIEDNILQIKKKIYKILTFNELKKKSRSRKKKKKKIKFKQKFNTKQTNKNIKMDLLLLHEH